VIVGAMNMMGNVGAYLCPLHIGKLFEHVKKSNEGSWGLTLWLLAAVSAGAAIAWSFVNPRRSLDESPSG